MPGRRLARFNRRVTNRVLGPLAPRLPSFMGFGVIVHTGRKSGSEYRTPVNIFRRQSGYVAALPYGRQSDWVQNVLTAGGCQLEQHGRTIRLGNPRLLRRDDAEVPAPLRLFGRVARVAEFLALSAAEA